MGRRNLSTITYQCRIHGPGLSVIKRNVILDFWASEPIETVSRFRGLMKFGVLFVDVRITWKLCCKLARYSYAVNKKVTHAVEMDAVLYDRYESIIRTSGSSGITDRATPSTSRREIVSRHVNLDDFVSREFVDTTTGKEFRRMTSATEDLKEDGSWRGSEANSIHVEALVEPGYEGYDNVCFP